jgi:hypothetical protein
MASATSPGTASSSGIVRRRRQRVATPLVAATHGPPSTRLMAVRTGPSWMPQRALTEPAADDGSAGVTGEEFEFQFGRTCSLHRLTLGVRYFGSVLRNLCKFSSLGNWYRSVSKKTQYRGNSVSVNSVWFRYLPNSTELIIETCNSRFKS